MFRKKTESMSISEFLNGKESKTEIRVHPGMFSAVPIGVIFAHSVAAESTDPVVVASATTKESIRHAFDPLIEMITTVSYPMAAVIMTGAGLMFLIGFKEKGVQYIQNAALGFILVQMMPLFLDILFGIGESI